MKPIQTLEADLWLAQRANRRYPSEEKQALVDSIEAEIAALTNPLPTADPAAEANAQSQNPTANDVEEKPKKETKPKAPAKKKEEELK